ncbi:MAG: hypothetical protein ACRC5M_06815 [Anaeroplasmataceae bacterium]
MLLSKHVFEDKAEVLKEYKYVTVNNSLTNIRLDNITLKMENKEQILERSTHFGTLYCDMFEVNDFIFSKTNIANGTIYSLESSVTNAMSNGTSSLSMPSNFIQLDGKRPNMWINKALYGIDSLIGYKMRKASLVNNVTLPMNADVYEDTLNLSYSRTIGNLIAVISRSSFSIPFRCDIIIDTKYGINIKNINLLINDSDIKMAFKQELKYLYKALNTLNKSIKHECDIEGRELRIYASVREFDIFINVVDVDTNTSFNFHMNNSDHTRAMMTTMSHLGKNWSNTDTFGDLIETECETIIPSMFWIEDRRFAFETESITDNFEVTYG